MKRIRQLGFLRLAFGQGRESVAEDGRVLHLFRNRIELKKSYSGALEEVQQLKDRVKQQEGATARVQELLQGLEARLAQPDSAYPTLVFYQLRELWNLGRNLLQQFVGELEAQKIEQERKSYFAQFNRQQFGRRQTVEAAYMSAEGAASAARAGVNEQLRLLAGLQRFWHYFQRRSVNRALHAANIQALLAEQALSEARAARDQLEGEQPNFAGLSLEARRAINLATIAYGQVLCDRLTRAGLMEATRTVSSRREPAEGEYGNRQKCERLMNDIQRARLLLERRSDALALIQAGSEGLRRVAQYRNATDTVPDAEALAAAAVGTATRVLSEDCWDIYRVLLR
ncbi:MAG TPA: hypothetical protein VK130_11360 [Steroidobacteraceae bacterium]|nr:hypothetical protein [Steroidobacteraceae bacterium]